MNINFTKIATIILLAITAINANAYINSVDYTKKVITLKQNHIIDIDFKSSKKEAAPFEVEFTAEFTSNSGKKLVVPGFYNGDKEWVIRFSANEVGKWSFITTSTNKALNNRKGIVNVISDTRFKGAIVRGGEKGNRFFYENGSPYFLMGFECDFLFALNYHNEEETPELDNFLDKVNENGFNHLVMNAYAHDVVWGKDEKLPDYPQYEFGELMSIFPFGGDNKNPDFTTLNVEFFEKLDRVIAKLNDRDIISHLMIYVWNKDVSWPDGYTLEDNRYFDYVVKRYQAFPNIMWDISKEALFYGRVDDAYIIDRIKRLRSLDTYKRQMTVHDFGFCVRNHELLDFISTQDWNLDIYNRMHDIYNKFSTKPTFNIEHGGYEECDFHVFPGNYTSSEHCLRRSYQSLFAGTYATHYWQGCSWNVIIYDYFNLDSEKHYIPDFEYYKHLTTFFQKYNYNEFVPLPNRNNSGYCMTNNQGIFLYYLPKESYTFKSIEIKDNLENMRYRWFNTRTGEYTDYIKMRDDRWFLPESPFYMEDDAIFILEGTPINK